MHLICFFPFIFIAFRFLIKATRAIEELEGPASKLSTVKFTRTATKMKSEKTDKMQAPGAGKDAKAAAGIEATADKKRTTAEQPESEGLDMMEDLGVDKPLTEQEMKGHFAWKKPWDETMSTLGRHD